MLPLILFLSLLSQVDHTAPDRRVVGLLELPEIFGEFPCDRYAPQPVTVHALPSDESPPLGFLELLKPWYEDEGSPCEWIEVGFRDGATSDTGPVRIMEFSYEEPALVVRESNGDWFLTDLGSRAGWIQSQDPARFHSYPALVQDSLAYLTANGPRLLWDSPGSDDPIPLPDEWDLDSDDTITVEVLGDRIVRDQLWLRIRLDPEYGCENPPDNPPVFREESTESRRTVGSVTRLIE